MPKKQTEIPGTERLSIPDLDEAIGEVIDLESKTARSKQLLAEAKAHVETLLIEHNRKKYIYVDGERQRGVVVKQGKSKLQFIDEAAR